MDFFFLSLIGVVFITGKEGSTGGDGGWGGSKEREREREWKRKQRFLRYEYSVCIRRKCNRNYDFPFCGTLTKPTVEIDL